MDARDSLEIIEKHLASISRSLHKIAFTMEDKTPNKEWLFDCKCEKNTDGALKEYNPACPIHTTTTTKHYLDKKDEKIHPQND